MDPIVIRALTEPGVVSIVDVTATHKEPAKLRTVQVKWLGKTYPELWNFVEVTPPSATAEDIAASLWADPAKTTMAFAIRKFGNIARVAPGHARSVIARYYRGEVVGHADVDPSRAEQMLAVARTDLANDAVAVRQYGDVKPQHATPEAIATLDRNIGSLLETLAAQVAPVHMTALLAPAQSERAARQAKLATDGAQWLPLLQFQHAQLLTISPRIRPLAMELAPLLLPFPNRPRQQVERAEALQYHLKIYVTAAGVSHLRNESTLLLRDALALEAATQRNQLEDEIIDVDSATRTAIQSHERTAPGTSDTRDRLVHHRQRVENGYSESQYDRQQVLTQAGEVALESRLRAVEHTLIQLAAAADDAGFMDHPEDVRKWNPALPKTVPELIADVRAHIASLRATWQRAIKESTPTGQPAPDAPTDWQQWQARAAGLAAAREAFAHIAGDQSIQAFVREISKDIRHQVLVHVVTQLAVALLITAVTGLGAAALGEAVATALVADTASLAAAGINIAVNVSVNSLVQFAQAHDHSAGSFGLMMLENGLMEVLSRGMLRPFERAQKAALAEAQRIAALPHLSQFERAAVGSVSLGATEMTAQVVATTASQWTAHRLIETFHNDPKAQSNPFTETVIQQGLAIGIGKFFHGKLEAWKAHRTKLETTRFGQLPEAQALFKKREAFFDQARALAENPSPSPHEEQALLQLHEELVKEEARILLEVRRPAYIPTGPDGKPLSLPRSPTGGLAPSSMDPHTQIGWRDGRRSGYVQTREFGPNGQPVKQIDWTDHGRPGQHTDPHVHDYVPNPTGGTPKHGPARPPHSEEL